MVNMLKMEDLMSMSFGDVASEIDVTVKKTVNIRQYENETVEMNVKLKMDEPLSSGERLFITEAVAAQLEYALFVNMYAKKLVTETEFKRRKEELESAITNVMNKVETVTGKSMQRFMDLKIE